MRPKIRAVLALALMLATVGTLEAQRDLRGVRGEIQRSTLRPGARARIGLAAILLRDSSLNRFASLIDLNEEQQTRMRELADKYRSENADALDRMERMQEELQALRNTEERPTRQALAEVVERYEHPDLDLDRADMVLNRDARAILTPEQEIILMRTSRSTVRTSRSRLAMRRGVQPRGSRRIRDLERRSASRYRRAPISRMRRLRRPPRRPTRP